MEDLSLRKRYLIPPPTDERALIVPEVRWSRLVNRIYRASKANGPFGPIGWCLIGIAATCLVGALTLDALEQIAVLTIGTACFVCGALSLYFARREGASRSELLKMVLEDMGAIGGVVEKDSPQHRLRYRSVAYLARFVETALQEREPLVRGEQFDWDLEPTSEQISLKALRQRDRAPLPVAVEVSPDWPPGSSWDYAVQIAERLKIELSRASKAKDEAKGPPV